MREITISSSCSSCGRGRPHRSVFAARLCFGVEKGPSTRKSLPLANPGAARGVSAKRKAGWILFAIIGIEGTWVVLNWVRNGWAFMRYLGFGNGHPALPWGWVAAALVTVTYVGLSLRLPSVRQNLFRPSWLKVLGLGVAVAAGILEEVAFRKWVMDVMLAHGFGWSLQIATSAMTFGLAHGIWGLMGKSFRAAVGATIATGFLGALLAVVYLLSGRNVAPCVVAHFAINALIEPGLVLAVVRGEMSTSRKRPIAP